MKKVLSLAAALSVTASVAFAGGPVVTPVEPQPEVLPAAASSSGGGLLPILLGVAVIAAIAGGDGS